MTLGNQSSSKLQMGSSRNRDPLKLSRDEDPSWDLEDPPKPRRKPSRTYSVLFIIKTFINDHLIVYPSWRVWESSVALPCCDPPHDEPSLNWWYPCSKEDRWPFPREGMALASPGTGREKNSWSKAREWEGVGHQSGQRLEQRECSEAPARKRAGMEGKARCWYFSSTTHWMPWSSFLMEGKEWRATTKASPQGTCRAVRLNGNILQIGHLSNGSKCKSQNKSTFWK